MKVFVTGATGYLGKALLRALHQAGHDVVGLARSREKALSTGLPRVTWVTGNLREPAAWAGAAGECDAAVHVGFEAGPDAPAVDGKAVDALLAAGKGPFVYTSGVWVLGAERSGRPADEDAPTDAPAAVVAFRPAHERRVLAASRPDRPTAVVRPGIVFGGGRGGLTDGFFADALSGEGPSVLGDGRNRWPTAHVADVADVYVRILEKASSLAALPAGERVFHAVGHEGEAVEDIARAASFAAGQDGSVGFVPLEAARLEMGPFADALTLDQRVIAPRTERLLGFRPRIRGFVHNAAGIHAEWLRG